MGIRKHILTILALLAPVAVFAQINVDAPAVVGLNEQFNITFTLSEKPSSFEWSAGEDFQLVWGPQTGSSTSITIVNGKHSKVSKYTYTYVLLPRRNGNFTLPAAHAIVDKKDLYSKTVAIEVVSNGAQSAQGPGASSGASSGAVSEASSSASQDAFDSQAGAQGSARSANNDIFMRLSLSRTSAVVGEPITATLKLYTRTNVAGFEDAKFPTFNGFWAQEIEAPQNISFQRESVDGMIYNSAVLRRWVIIPQKTGNINIDAAELVCLLQQRVSTGNSIFDSFFDDYQTIRKRIFSSAYTVKVSPLPEAAPASFTGAVGNFKIKAVLSTDSLKVHDAASLMVTVGGRGNVALVGAPKVNFPPDSELYDVKTTDRMDKGSGGTSGSKVFEYPFIPRSHGDFEIPAIEFSYYDITSRKYVTLTTEALAYSVARGEGTEYVASEDGVNIPVVSKKDVKNLSDDIRYISTRLPKFNSGDKFFAATPLFWALTALLVILAVAVYVLTTFLRRRSGDVVKVRTRGASKAARKRLSVAQNYMTQNLYSAYYEELHKALLGYAADKLNIAFAALSKEGIATAFAKAGAPQALIDEYVELLDGCEFARYAPSGSNEAMQEFYTKAVEVISALDSNMKKSKTQNIAAMLVAILALVPSFGVQAQSQNYLDSLWNAGVQAYESGDYMQSAKNFSTIEALGLSGAELYTNIADACFKNQEYGQAILYYERALKLDPSFKDAKYNLEVARQMTLDRIEEVPEFFMKSWVKKLNYSLSSNVWAVIFLSLLALTLVLWLVFLLSSNTTSRKASFFTSIVTVLLCALALANSLSQKAGFEARDEAIVTRAVCAAKSSPSDNSGANLFVLHEGTKVKILDNVGDWAKISIADGREAWVRARELTII